MGGDALKYYLCRYSDGSEKLVPLKDPEWFKQMEGDHLLYIERIDENDWYGFYGNKRP